MWLLTDSVDNGSCATWSTGKGANRPSGSRLFGPREAGHRHNACAGEVRVPILRGLAVSVMVAHEEYIGTRAGQYARMVIEHYFKKVFASTHTEKKKNIAG